jgi:mannobiose 2-epimerase
MKSAPLSETCAAPTVWRAELDRELRGNILPFWLRHAKDAELGGFHGTVRADLTVDRAAARGMLLAARILWTFSAAARAWPEPEYRRMADHAAAALRSFRDERHGGYFWAARPDGTVTRDRKQVYGQAFAIYALTEYYALTGSLAVRDEALATLRLLEQHARDRAGGGYWEAFGRAWEPIEDVRLSEVDLNAPKSQNTLLHVMEAYTAFLRVCPHEEVREALQSLFEVMITRVYEARSGHLGLFFTADWQPVTDRVSYGHDIEAAWLLVDAAEAVGDAALRARVAEVAVRLADATLHEGVDAEGAIMNEGGPRGAENRDREWWPQAEAVVGFLCVAQLTGRAEYVQAAWRAWRFITTAVVDPAGGEWFRSVDAQGRVVPGIPKISFWKCPYHNGRACLEAARRLQELESRGLWPLAP